jgi:hypothetical protein
MRVAQVAPMTFSNFAARNLSQTKASAGLILAFMSVACLGLWLVPPSSRAGESVENLQKQLKFVEAILGNFDTIKANPSFDSKLERRPVFDKKAFCRDDVFDVHDKAAKNVAYAVLFVGDPEGVTRPMTDLLMQTATLQDLCAHTRNKELGRIPDLRDAEGVSLKIATVIETLTPRVVRVRDELKTQIQSRAATEGDSSALSQPTAVEAPTAVILAAPSTQVSAPTPAPSLVPAPIPSSDNWSESTDWMNAFLDTSPTPSPAPIATDTAGSQ